MLRPIANAFLRRTLRGLSQCYPSQDLHVGVVSAPFNKGQRKLGVERGPGAIKDTGLLDQLRDLGAEVSECGTVEEGLDSHETRGPDGERCYDAVMQYNHQLASRVTHALATTQLCLTLGGDHSVAIGTLAGHTQANPNHQVVVLWVDAHADVNVGKSSESGNMHGMPVAFHLQELNGQVNRLTGSWPTPRLRASNLSYIGLRDVDGPEEEYIKSLGIQAFYMRDVAALGMDQVIARAIQHLNPGPTRPLHLSFDIDALDPAQAPSTGTPVADGLSLSDGVSIARAARATGHLRAMDMVEVNPGLGDATQAATTADSARRIILEAIMGPQA